MPPRSSELLSILVPTYNEAGTVAAVVRRLLTIDLPVPREVIVVDPTTGGCCARMAPDPRFIWRRSLRGCSA